MERKLPVYILIDTSGSMRGEPIQQVNNGVKMFFRTVRKDAQVNEAVKIGFIEYNSSANVVSELTDLPQAQEPEFSAGGSTCLGAGLDLLAECIKNDVQIGDPKREIKGDYKPIVFHLTDGYPNDNWEEALNRFDRKSVVFIISFGVMDADRDVLIKVSGEEEFVYELESTSETEIAKLIKFMTQTISYASRSLPTNPDENISPNSLPSFQPIDEENLF